jgi:hypothetical protein
VEQDDITLLIGEGLLLSHQQCQAKLDGATASAVSEHENLWEFHAQAPMTDQVHENDNWDESRAKDAEKEQWQVA